MEYRPQHLGMKYRFAVSHVRMIYFFDPAPCASRIGTEGDTAWKKHNGKSQDNRNRPETYLVDPEGVRGNETLPLQTAEKSK